MEKNDNGNVPADIYQQLYKKIEAYYKAYAGEENAEYIIYQSIKSELEDNKNEELMEWLKPAIEKYIQDLKSFFNAYSNDGEGR